MALFRYDLINGLNLSSLVLFIFNRKKIKVCIQFKPLAPKYAALIITTIIVIYITFYYI